jgi:molybdopterin-guanine dinucleotide biosynthesis protein A
MCTDVVVASGDGHRLDHLGLPQVADAVPGAGPLGGIAAGLEAARHGLVAVVAVDMPAASPAVLTLLAGLWQGETAVVPVVHDRWEPLHAVWARSAAGGILACLQAGDRKVVRLLATLGVRLVEEGEWTAAEPTGTFAANLNVPLDLFRV